MSPNSMSVPGPRKRIRSVGAGLIKQDKAKAQPQEQPAKLALAKSGRVEAQNIRKDQNVMVTGDPQKPTIRH